MPKISLAGFKDPVRRPRYIIWTGVVVMLLAVVVILALGATSTRWFCAQVCHKVQDDSIIAYEHSSHNKVSCMACHMPVGANPVVFVLHKMKALGELYLTVTDNFELPLNPESEVAISEEMGSEQCTQCHSENRPITPSNGIIINHKIHEEEGVRCTLCHNRVAHREDFEPTLTDPKTGEKSHKHEDYMTMTACFRCHGLTPEAKAPGACSKCHTPDFPLKPESHFAKDFYPKVHAEMAKTALEETHEGEGGEGGEGAEGEGEGTESRSPIGIGVAYAQEGEAEGEGGEEEVPPVSSVFYCATCHQEQFCTNCHGMEMPHDQEFLDKSHPKVAETKLDKCEFCHHQSKTRFCDSCHHGESVGWQYKATPAWGTQHAQAVKTTTIKPCLERCHDEKFCSDCHTKKKPLPSSHRAKDWLRKPAAAIGVHADSAKKDVQLCEVCHGKGGTNARFCKACHKYEMPHPEDFKKFHARTGRSNVKACQYCHTFREVCSNCHHEGSSNTVPWLRVHPKTVGSKGTAGCFEKCHKADFCVACHTKSKVVPTSHKGKAWTRDASSKTALHAQSFQKQPDNCTFCHGKGGPESNRFCINCHKLPMPHPAEFKDTHKDQFTAKKLNKTMCVNCHVQRFCDKCHHPDYTGKQTWIKEHQLVVGKTGAEPCFECHKPTYCSYCHVRQIH